MRNSKLLKSVLSLVLVLAMVLGTVTTSYAEEVVETEVTAETVETEVVNTIEAVITVGEDMLSSEALDIVSNVQEQKVAEAENAIASGEQKVEENVKDLNEAIKDVETSVDNAEAEAEKAEAEADKAEAALEEANNAEASADAKEQQAEAEQAAKDAQVAADVAKTEEQAAKDAYVAAQEAYNAALKEAAAAEEAAKVAYGEAASDAEVKAELAKAAHEKAQELKAAMEAARECAEEHFTAKEEQLSQAQKELDDAKENLDKVVAEEEAAREEVKEATEAVVETGAFLVAAEAYEALAEVTVEGIETAITVMEEAKELADKALAEAEEALENAEGDKAEAQAAYDVALEAYNAANATLEQANADLEAAKAEKAAADALAATEYGKKITAIEEELLAAEKAGDTAAVEEKTQELISTIIKYDQNTADAKYDTVELEDATNKIYVATDANGNKAYYQYVQNVDGTVSFFECEKNEEGTHVLSRETVTELPSFEGMNDWEYKVTDLGNGTYEIEYLDVVSADKTFDNKEDAESSILAGEDKAIVEFEVPTTETSETVKFPEEPKKPTEPVDWETFAEENGIDSKLETMPEAPKRENYWTTAGYNAAKAFYENVTLPAWQTIKNLYEEKVASYEAEVAEYKAAVDKYADEMTAYTEKKAAADALNAQRNAELLAHLAEGDKLTITVNGVKREVKVDEDGNLFYMTLLGKATDLEKYVVTVAGTTTNYRVVEYNETIKVDYEKKDNEADDSYENITNKVTVAQNNFTTATNNATTAAANKTAAEAKEQQTASELADAVAELEDVQKVHDVVSGLHDSYYGNEEKSVEIPEEVMTALKWLGIEDTEKILDKLEDWKILDTLGIDRDKVGIIIEDGELRFEIPGTSKYDQHMLALKVAEVAAEENLKAAQKAVEEKREAHEAALEDLATKTVEYSEAVQAIADALLVLGEAELKVGVAKIDLEVAQRLYEASVEAAEFAAELEAKVADARAKAEAARDYLNELKENVSVSSDVLAKAEEALAEAEAELATAEAAALKAQKEADEAQAAFDAIVKKVEELIVKETVAGLSLSATSVELVKDKAGSETTTLIATVTPDTALNKNVTWTSSNPAVATVDADGTVKAVGVGKAVITVTTAEGNFTETCEVIVKQAVTGIELNTTYAETLTNAEVVLKATVGPEEASNKTVIWTSSNEGIATVNANGVVRTHNDGTVYITATTEDGGYTDTCEIRVFEYSFFFPEDEEVEETVVIEDEATPLANDAEEVEEIEEADELVDIEDEETPLADGAEEANDETVVIEDEETPLTDGAETAGNNVVPVVVASAGGVSLLAVLVFFLKRRKFI